MTNPLELETDLIVIKNLFVNNCSGTEQKMVCETTEAVKGETDQVLSTLKQYNHTCSTVTLC